MSNRSWRVLALLAAWWPAMAAERLTLKEAEEMALRLHPQLEAARARVAEAEAVPAQVRSRIQPQAFVSTTGAVAEDANTRILAGGLNNPVILNRMASGVGVSQIMTDFGRTRHLAESATLRAQSAAEAAGASRAGILLRVDQAYFAALRARAVLRVAEETVRARELVTRQVGVLAANKLKSQLDLSFAKVNLEEAKLLENGARNETRVSLVELSQAIGLDQVREIELSEEAMPEALPPDWATAEEAALRQRPELKQARLDEQAAAEFVRAERALVLPTVSAVAAAGYSPLHAARLQGHWDAAGITVDIPVLNGGLFRARRAEAEARQRTAGAASREIRNRVLRDVRLAFVRSVNAFERLRLTSTLLEQARLSLELAQARYELGLGNIIELSQAQLNVTNAQISETSARYEYQVTRAALEYEKGSF